MIRTIQTVKQGSALLALAMAPLLGGAIVAPPAPGSDAGASSPVPTAQPAPTTPPDALLPRGPSYGHLLMLRTEHALLDVGQLVPGGAYSGMEGDLFALRYFNGWSYRRPGLPRLVLNAADEQRIPASEPGIDEQRDDPKREYLRWRLGRDGDSLHLELGLLHNTLGHGSTVRMFQNVPEGAPLAFGLAAEGQLNGGGLVLLLGDMFHPGRFVAGRLRVKPLNIILSPDSALQPNGLDVDPRAELLGFLIVGATAAADLEAPVVAEAIDEEGKQLPGSGARPVATFGLDLETPPVDMWVFHVNPYLDGVMMMGRGDGPGFGLHPGISAGTSAIGLFWLLSAQYYVGSQGYKPWYFDTRYVFERTRTIAEGAPKASLASPAPASHGYSAGLSAQLAEVVTLWLEMGDQIPLDAADGTNYGRFRTGLTAGPTMANMTLSYMREGWRDYGRVFADDGLTAFVAQAKLSVLLVGFVARYTYSVEHNIDTGERFDNQEFAVGTELGFSF